MSITDLAYIDAAGFHLADYPTFLAWLQSAYRGIYGADTYLGSDSKDGQFLAVVAQALFDTASLGASDYNSFSPATAQGLGLSRNVKINGLRRGVPTNSTVNLTIVGQSATVITNGVAVDTFQQKWNLPSTVTIPSGGSIVVTATADQVGDVSAAIGAVTGIFTPTLGWQSVTNAAAAIEGAPVETDAQLRARQATSTANPSLTVLDGTRGAIANLVGVTKVKSYENTSDSTDGNGLPPHSVCFVVQGGDVMEVAEVIQLHKTPGTNTYASGTNAVQETIYDSQGLPVLINFYSPPVPANIAVVITGGKNLNWSSDYVAQIQNAVAAAINAGNIGQKIIFTTLYQPAYLVGTPAYGSFNIETMTLNKNGAGPVSADITLAFNEVPVCLPSNVSVTIT